MGLIFTLGTLAQVGARHKDMSHPAQFGIWPIVAYVHVNEILWGFSPTLVVKGGLDQHIRLLESIPPSLG